jgi:uncharacterized membrane-anchored protein YhcB (DUF1043 family)
VGDWDFYTWWIVISIALIVGLGVIFVVVRMTKKEE